MRPILRVGFDPFAIASPLPPFVLRSGSFVTRSHYAKIAASTDILARRETGSPHATRRHASTRRHVSSSAIPLAFESQRLNDESASMTPTGLSCLPLSNLVRSYMIMLLSSIPAFLRPSLVVLDFLAHSKSILFNPDRNFVIHFLLKRTFYAQFCAGETPADVQRTIQSLKEIGYRGVILGHCREVVMKDDEQTEFDKSMNASNEQESAKPEISEWKNANLDTINLTARGDFVAVKFSGAGKQALQHLRTEQPCSSALKDAMHEMCRQAQSRGVGLLLDAEQAALQRGIENWGLYFMKVYNNHDQVTVYGTYQAYAKRTPEALSRHLKEAQEHDFPLGVKLVRGAYMGSDPRQLFWDTIQETHTCYDNLVACLLERRYAGLLQPTSAGQPSFPRVNLVLASHNSESVRKAHAIRESQTSLGREKIPLSYGQLLGMADHISCELVQVAKQARTNESIPKETPQAYKHLVWGTLGECMKYLLRRAQENKDAMSRTIDARQALGKELARRLGWTRA